MPDEPKDQTDKLFRMNQVQTALIIIATAFGIIGAATAWAKGWLGLPEKVEKLQTEQKALADLPTRVIAIEETQKQFWIKRGEDHDLLQKIDQSLQDVKIEQRDLRDDLKTVTRRP